MVKKVKWDPGHGGKDSGAVEPGGGLYEKNLALKIVNYAMDYMARNYSNVEQSTTRTGDTYPSLQNRCDQANNMGADVFVSVHINGGGGTGYESLIFGRQDPITNSLQDNLNRELLAVNAKYGKKAHGNNPIKIRPDLHVLNGTHMPAVLTENLYIDSNDIQVLRDENYLREVGEAHARGVAAHLGLPKKNVTPPQPKEQFVYFETGGFTHGPSMEKFLNFVRDNKFGTSARIDNFNLVFITGDYSKGGASYNKMTSFMKENGIWYQEFNR